MWEIDKRFKGWTLWKSKDAEDRPIWSTSRNADDGTAVEPWLVNFDLSREQALYGAETYYNGGVRND